MPRARIAWEGRVIELDSSHLIAIAAALGWASGLRLYAVLFFVGIAGHFEWVPMPPGLALWSQPLVLGATGLMLAVEFFADKIPGVDSAWDVVHTVIRVPAGAALTASVLGGDGATWTLIAALMGGTLAATSHVAKATTRAAVNTSPEPFSNLGLSLVGDAVVPGMLYLAWEQPLWFFGALGVAVVAGLVATFVLFRFLRAIVRRIRARIAGEAVQA
ncbi:MAG: DUF4126 domain-containing protein [Myxococcota bacterium]